LSNNASADLDRSTFLRQKAGQEANVFEEEAPPPAPQRRDDLADIGGSPFPVNTDFSRNSDSGQLSFGSLEKRTLQFCSPLNHKIPYLFVLSSF
jgi:hypothetical protein